jgi:hypothetical protein
MGILIKGTPMRMTAIIFLWALPTIAAAQAGGSGAYECNAQQIQALADELAGDASAGKTACSVPDARLAEHNDLIRRFVEVASAGKGAFSVQKTCLTVEGDPILKYIVTRDGELLLVTDSRRDTHGPRDVCAGRVDRVELGYLAPDAEGGSRFVALGPGASPEGPLVVRCLPQDVYF